MFKILKAAVAGLAASILLALAFVAPAAAGGYGNGAGSQYPFGAYGTYGSSYGNPSASNAGMLYIVVRGDTMSMIARRYGTTVGWLMQANPSIYNPNVIYAGMVLVIPTGYPQPYTPGGYHPQAYQPPPPPARMYRPPAYQPPPAYRPPAYRMPGYQAPGYVQPGMPGYSWYGHPQGSYPQYQPQGGGTYMYNYGTPPGPPPAYGHRY